MNRFIYYVLMMKRFLIGLLFLPLVIFAHDIKDIEYGFIHPQDSARTKMWWFHGKYPSSKEAMTKDLEAFKEAGIGGIVFYDQVHGDQLPDTERTMSQAWWENVYHVARETKRLGLDFEFHVSNGFVAGGPWIQPKDAMKRLECIETLVTGGEYVERKLEVPQNSYRFYQDVKVLALPTSDVADSLMHVSCNRTDMDAKSLFDTDALQAIPVPQDEKPVYIDIDYQVPRILRSISYLIGPSGKATTSATNVPAEPQESFTGTGYYQLPPIGELQYSEDGEVYHRVCLLKPLYRAHESYKRKTLSFDAVKARFYRIKLSGWNESEKGKALRLGGIVLSGDAKINEYEYKAGLISEYIERDMESPDYTCSESVPVQNIVDITGKLGKDGILRWRAPAGKWKVLRFCMVPTGKKTKHGRPDGMGLECDKMSVAATTLQFNSYFNVILDSLDSHRINNLKGMAMDSHEAGAQNWTDDFLSAFDKLRGYKLDPYLPVMAGYVVGDVRTSEAVLYDVRQTIAELIAERYYGTFDRLCRERNVVFTAQATGNAQCIVAIPVEAKGKVQKPQGEFWVMQPDGNYDIKESSSAAHLYGKPVASAEAFTDGTIATMPCDLKNIADAAYSFGINEFVVCASAHQPDDAKPGNPGGRCYQVYSRNNTWWKNSREFWDYQARVSYIMRQGKPAIDLCVYLGNNAPVRILTHRLPKIPAGYDFDAFTEDALLNRMQAVDGKVTLPDGQSYAMMVLPRSGEISLAALRRIALFVAQGVCVYGNRPTGSPCKEDIGLEAEYEKLVSRLWDKKQCGKGKVFSDMTLAEALDKAGIRPDVSGPNLYFAHRKTKDSDVYFLNNHSDQTIRADYQFKTSYQHAQLWDAVTGKQYQLLVKNGTVSLAFAPRESYFVVFSDALPETEEVYWNGLLQKEMIDSEWNVYFDPACGGVGPMKTQRLSYWNQSENPAVRFYSGTAVYHTSFDWNHTDAAAVRLQLEKNNNWVIVYVNGKKAGSIWASPWNLDITPYLKQGKNGLKLEVTNSWNNRAIGDLLHALDERLTVDPQLFVTPDSPLQDAGLSGEVSLIYK